jgi:phosphatidylserine decarboxylase
VTIKGEQMTVVFKQIAGLLARRIVFTGKVGDKVERGQRVGMIKFGSRTDVIFPATAEIKIKVGDRVKGGATILAQAGVRQPNQTSTLSPTETIR